MKTLIVCAANVCRSPAAEVMWRSAAVNRGLADAVSSAGVQARPGQPPSTSISRALVERGFAMPGRGANPFIRAVACRHELILVMEPAQQRQVIALAPELMGRVHLLGRWGQGTITDPTGGTYQDYEDCLDRIAQAVDAWMDRLALPKRGVSRATVYASCVAAAPESAHA